MAVSVLSFSLVYVIYSRYIRGRFLESREWDFPVINRYEVADSSYTGVCFTIDEWEVYSYSFSSIP